MATHRPGPGRQSRAALAFALAFFVAAAPAVSAVSQDGQKVTSAEQARRDRDRLDRAKREYEAAQRQEASEIRARAKRDAAALRRGGQVEEAQASAGRQRLAAEARQRLDAERRRQQAIREAERELREARRAYEAALEAAARK